MAKILIVDDDELLSDILRDALSQKRHVVEQVYDGETALELVTHYKYDLIILDWNLPSRSGIEIAQKLKKKSSSTMILMLTSKAYAEDKLTGLESGADDYMTKPVQMDEFASRVMALLRRSGYTEPRQVRYKDLILELDSGVLKNADQQVALPPKELELLELLIRHADEHLSTEALLERLWGGGASRAALANCLKRLRVVLGTLGHRDSIETVSSLGYCLKR